MEQLTKRHEMAGRLAEARRRAGYETVADAARSLGVKYPTYASHENGSAGIRHPVAERYARKFKVSLEWLLTGRGSMLANGVAPAEMEVSGLPVLGSIQAGHWLETTFLDSEGEPELLPVARDARFPRARQYALYVVGDSMDLDYPDGSYVTCVDFAESGLAIVDGLTVHVERHRAGGQLVEITLKRVVAKNGIFSLVPRSSNAIHQPITFTGDDSDVVIRGVVTGGWRQTDIPR
jgi:SOS-response transcriptional repressor LexA